MAKKSYFVLFFGYKNYTLWEKYVIIFVHIMQYKYILAIQFKFFELI